MNKWNKLLFLLYNLNLSNSWLFLFLVANLDAESFFLLIFFSTYSSDIFLKNNL